ncbi:MAG TPA: ferritin-like domain-containing protein [Paenalcaligenes sp.]|nr:ferritin-like domain-containing protein [Paenalcaligenes sp.]
MREHALEALLIKDPLIKSQAVQEMHAQISMPVGADVDLQCTEQGIPGRPAKPDIVDPRQVKQRSMHTTEGRAALLHALAHIEFNAINLALDIIWRYPDLPSQFYGDWLQVAFEEVYHFNLLDAHLQSLGFAYGDFPAHDGLWDMAERTCDDLIARLAMVPRTLEARGLDACPVMRDKLAQAGDQGAADILDIILRDEVGHVAAGNRWYRWACAQKAVDPEQQYPQLAKIYRAPRFRGPLNIDARRDAGFTETEIQYFIKQHAADHRSSEPHKN